jgi:hypothetical protein
MAHGGAELFAAAAAAANSPVAAQYRDPAPEVAEAEPEPEAEPEAEAAAAAAAAEAEFFQALHSSFRSPSPARDTARQHVSLKP